MLAAQQRMGDGVGANVRTSWPTVYLAIGAGVLAAFQLGKVHIGLPSLRQSFSLGLVSASWILSALNIVGLFAATPAGTLATRLGNKRAVVIGLALLAISSAAGGFAPTLSWLLVSRLVEGVGFVLIVVAAPSLIVETTSPENIRLALAGWSAYIPGGIALISFCAAPVLVHHTWRTVWWMNAVALAALAVVLALVAKGAPPRKAQEGEPGTWREMTAVVSARAPLSLALIFGMYTMQHLSVMGFMPTLLHERFHLPETHIGILVSIAMASNILGNLAAGVLLQRGVGRARMIAVTSIFMAVMTVGMFLLPLPLTGFYLCAFCFSCVGGLVPSAVMGAAPFHAPSRALLGATNGLLVQGSNLGIVLGPLLMSAIATRLGWQWVPVMTGIAAVMAAVLAISMQNTTHSDPDCLLGQLSDSRMRSETKVSRSDNAHH